MRHGRWAVILHPLGPSTMSCYEKTEFGALKYPYVIASQCAHWRGNPHPLTRLDDENAKRRTDCHTSDNLCRGAVQLAKFQFVGLLAEIDRHKLFF